jgi:hypothetical protein
MLLWPADAISFSFIFDETLAGAPMTGANAMGFTLAGDACSCGAVSELTTPSPDPPELLPEQAAMDRASRPMTGNARCRVSQRAAISLTRVTKYDPFVFIASRSDVDRKNNAKRATSMRNPYLESLQASIEGQPPQRGINSI